jgi:hypothetical protein
MTTDELVERLNKNERVIARRKEGKVVVCNDGGNPVVAIDDQATNIFELDWRCRIPYVDFGKPSREYITAQIEEYLQTPIEQRKSEKKYYLLARSGSIWPYMKARYVTRITTQVDSAAFDYGNKPTVFTEKELSTIKKFDPVLAPAIELMKVPVKEGDKC